jgi:hypothetical protein
VNLYAYAGNNPIGFSDPFGLRDTLLTEGSKGGKPDAAYKALADAFVAQCRATSAKCNSNFAKMDADNSRGYVVRVTDANFSASRPCQGLIGGCTVGGGPGGRVYMFVNPNQFSTAQASRAADPTLNPILQGPVFGAIVVGHESEHGLTGMFPNNPCQEPCAEAAEITMRQQMTQSAISAVRNVRF